MLSYLTISNYVFIEKLAIDFQSGFSVVTGETGAGKSILLGALGLILGDRADKDVVIEDSKKCIIEGHFDIENLNLKHLFLLHDIDYDSVCILRREVTSAGKSRAFINDTPVKLPLMKELGMQLIDVHSQNQNQQLNNALFRLNLLDAYANHTSLLQDYSNLFKQYKSDFIHLEKLKNDYTKQLNEREYHQFLFDELENTNIQKGEQDEIEEELQLLNHAEEIKSNLFYSAQELMNTDDNIISKLEVILDKLSKIAPYQDSIKSLEQRIQSAYIELKDIGEGANSLEEQFQFDPSRLEFINDRLDTLYTLTKKHSLANADDLLMFQDLLSQKIHSVINLEEKIENAEKRLIIQREEIEIKAEEISTKRKLASGKIEKLVLNNLRELGMEKAELEIYIEKLDELTSYGKDKVSFLFKANTGGKLAEINKVASGGELSRIMLSFKYVLALKQALPTIVFDEIDTGVSGEIADKLAKLMKSLGESLQVISISHLPQIASKADYHYLVYKENESTFTRSNMRKLNEQERMNEIAAMLSGSKIGDSAIEHAKELLGS